LDEDPKKEKHLNFTKIIKTRNFLNS